MPIQSLAEVALRLYYPCPVVPPIYFRILVSWSHTYTLFEPPWSSYYGGSSLHSMDEAEKGTYDNSLERLAPGFVYVEQTSPLLPTASPVHQGITPYTSVPELSLLLPAEQNPINAATLETTLKNPATKKPRKPEISRWILFDLWFNTYRKFFVVVVSLNLTGIILAALNRFHYAENHLGALVLGNMLCAILVRNELWMRSMYLLAIYGLGVCVPLPNTQPSLTHFQSGHQCA